MADDDPTPLDYAGRTPNAAGRIDGETKSLGEGCAAMVLLVVAMPVVMLFVFCLAISCLVTGAIGIRFH